ncbi:MAG: hypothetical protein HPY50_02815 [Firmicutes bacterium]|nr:hypothetical protein [Bacillota bacterium]
MPILIPFSGGFIINLCKEDIIHFNTYGFSVEDKSENLAYWLGLLEDVIDDYLYIGFPLNVRMVAIELFYEPSNLPKRGIEHYIKRLESAIHIDSVALKICSEKINELLNALSSHDSTLYLTIANEVLKNLSYDYIERLCVELIHLIRNNGALEEIQSLTRCFSAEIINNDNSFNLVSRLPNPFIKEVTLDQWLKERILPTIKESKNEFVILIPIIIASTDFHDFNNNLETLCSLCNSLSIGGLEFYNPKVNPKYPEEEEDILNILKLTNETTSIRIHASLRINSSSHNQALYMARRRLDLFLDTAVISSVWYVDFTPLPHWALLDQSNNVKLSFMYNSSKQISRVIDRDNFPHRHYLCSFIHIESLYNTKLFSIPANYFLDLIDKKTFKIFKIRTAIYWFRKALLNDDYPEIQLPLLWSSLEAIIPNPHMSKTIPNILSSLSFERLIFVLRCRLKNWGEDVLSFDRKSFLENLASNDLRSIYLTNKVNDLLNISNNKSLTLDFISKAKTSHQILLGQCYRNRNMLVHGGSVLPPIIKFHADYLRFVVNNIFKGLIILSQHFAHLPINELLDIWSNSIVNEKFSNNDYIFNPALFISDIIE